MQIHVKTHPRGDSRICCRHSGDGNQAVAQRYAGLVLEEDVEIEELISTDLERVNRFASSRQ